MAAKRKFRQKGPFLQILPYYYNITFITAASIFNLQSCMVMVDRVHSLPLKPVVLYMCTLCKRRWVRTAMDKDPFGRWYLDLSAVTQLFTI